MTVETQIGARANCDRCGREMQLKPPSNPKSWPFKLAVKPKGFCADCVMTQFLYNTYPINMQLDQGGPGLLLHPQMREAVLMSGLLSNCDMNVNEINWHRVVANWSLPIECETSATNPYRMGDAARDKQNLIDLENAVAVTDQVTTAILEAANCDSDAAREALERDGTVFLTSRGAYSRKDLANRHRLRSIIENCGFCGGRGCLSCEAQEREARRRMQADVIEKLEVDGQDLEADDCGVYKATKYAM